MSTSRDRSLQPHVLDRLPSIPPQLRSPRARRVLAALLVGLAAVSAVRADPDRGTADMVVAARDLTPGTVVGETDLRVTRVSPDVRPLGALTSPADASGQTVAGPIRDGEPITDVRLLGPRLAAAALGPGADDARVVPIRLADPQLAELLRAGDTVDVVTAGARPEDSPTAVGGRILAADATVVMVSAAGTGAARREQLVLVALRAAAATTVAAASLTEALTVTLH